MQASVNLPLMQVPETMFNIEVRHDALSTQTEFAQTSHRKENSRLPESKGAITITPNTVDASGTLPPEQRSV